MGYHAYLPASGAGCWVHCPRWPYMNAKYPKPDDPETLLGNAAHWALHAQWFDGLVVKPGDCDPAGHPITADMLTDIAPIVDTLVDAKQSQGVQVIAETYLPCPSVHERNGGSPDAVFIWPGARAMEVHDFKYGHLPVDARENWQMVDYACAVLDHFNEDGSNWAISFHVHQPRDFTHKAQKYWDMPQGAIRAYRNILEMAADKAVSHSPEYIAGPHCRDCPGRTHCPANQRAALDVLRAVEVGDDVNLAPKDLGREYTLLQRGEAFLKSRRKALEDEITSRIRKGEAGFGYSLETNRWTALKWTEEPEVIARKAMMYGKDIRKPVEVTTPTQALRAGVPKELVDGSAQRFQADPELVPTSETMAYKAFTANKE